MEKYNLWKVKWERIYIYNRQTQKKKVGKGKQISKVGRRSESRNEKIIK